MASRNTGERYPPQGIQSGGSNLFDVPNCDYSLLAVGASPDSAAITKIKSNGFPIKTLDYEIVGASSSITKTKQFYTLISSIDEAISTLAVASVQNFTKLTPLNSGAYMPTKTVLAEIV